MKKLLSTLLLALLVIALPVGLVGCKTTTKKDSNKNEGQKAETQSIAATSWQASVTDDDGSALKFELDAEAVAEIIIEEKNLALGMTPGERDRLIQQTKESVQQVFDEFMTADEDDEDSTNIANNFLSSGDITYLYVTSEYHAYIWVEEDGSQKATPLAKLTYIFNPENGCYIINYISIETQDDAREAYEARNIEADEDVISDYEGEALDEESNIDLTLTAKVDFSLNKFTVNLSPLFKSLAMGMFALNGISFDYEDAGISSGSDVGSSEINEQANENNEELTQMQEYMYMLGKILNNLTVTLTFTQIV